MPGKFFSIVTSRNGSREAFNSLRNCFSHNAMEYSQHAVGWQGGSCQVDVFWHAPFGIWGVFEESPPKESKPRYWNVFGTDDPAAKSMLNIAVEINPPHEGEDARLAGTFLRDEQSRLYLGHSGKVGGGRKGVGQSAFHDYYRAGKWQPIASSTAKERMLVVFGPVDDPAFIPSLSEFVKAVARFKSFAVGR